jgi:tRNA(adenine34) deaminase
MPSDIGTRLMRLALAEAAAARESGDIAVGAVLAIDVAVVALGRSRQSERGTPLAHAELEVLNCAAQEIAKSSGAVLLVTTVEPCLMCLGAALRVGVGEIIFGATNPNAGIRLLAVPPPGLIYRGGVLEDQAAALLG